MRNRPSRFVDSEKALKRQLQALLDLQNAEKRRKTKAGDASVLGVKIANRYLGEDMLPYPKSRGDEKEWEAGMERRKAELKAQDAREWDEMMREYDEVMAEYVEKNERVDHELGAGDEHAAQTGDSHLASDGGGESNGGKGDVGSGGVSIHPPAGSAKWPSPSQKAGDGTTILLEPAFGSHRPGSNAVLAFAEGYDISIYLAFVESLRATDYDGDVVFSISVESRLKPGVRDYLRSVRPGPDGKGINVVAYEVEWTCFTGKGEPATGSREGMHPCKMDGAFGGGPDGKEAVNDPREPRPVATARYELYWIWSLRYRETSWLMLIDARDVWFQLDPFEELMERGDVSGELHFFGVSLDADGGVCVLSFDPGSKFRSLYPPSFLSIILKFVRAGECRRGQDRHVGVQPQVADDRLREEDHRAVPRGACHLLGVDDRQPGRHRDLPPRHGGRVRRHALQAEGVRPGISQLPLLLEEARPGRGGRRGHIVADRARAGEGHHKQPERAEDQAAEGVGHVRPGEGPGSELGRLHEPGGPPDGQGQGGQRHDKAEEEGIRAEFEDMTKNHFLY